MRFVFVGTGTLALLTCRLMIKRRHDVVMIERDKDAIERLADELECGFLHGDATRPAILREAEPERTDLLFCLTHDDQANIIISLAAKTLGFRRVVTKIEDPDLEHICTELGLGDSMVPLHTVGRYLADMAEGQNIIELSDIFRGEARVFAFQAGEASAGSVRELELPPDARVICYYRDGDFHLADEDSHIKAGDELVVLTTSKFLKALREKFAGG